MENASMFLSKLGLNTLQELMNCSLLIHITYGGTTTGGRTLVAKVDWIEIRDHEIYFDFDNSKITFSLDPEPKKQACKTLRDFDGEGEIEIAGLSFDGSKWVAIITTPSLSIGELHERNLTVEMIRP